jgi:Na+-driven multidrug efflux pump
LTHELFLQMALAVPSILVLLYFPQFWGISAVWVGLSTVMTLRMLAGFWRYVLIS